MCGWIYVPSRAVKMVNCCTMDVSIFVPLSIWAEHLNNNCCRLIASHCSPFSGWYEFIIFHTKFSICTFWTTKMESEERIFVCFFSFFSLLFQRQNNFVVAKCWNGWAESEKKKLVEKLLCFRIWVFSFFCQCLLQEKKKVLTCDGINKFCVAAAPSPKQFN